MTAAISAPTASSIDPRIAAVASGIGAAIPDAEVRVLGALWRQYSSHRLPLDLLLYSQSEVSQRQQYRGAVTTRAYEEGILLHG